MKQLINKLINILGPWARAQGPRGRGSGRLTLLGGRRPTGNGGSGGAEHPQVCLLFLQDVFHNLILVLHMPLFKVLCLNEVALEAHCSSCKSFSKYRIIWLCKLRTHFLNNIFRDF